MGRFANSWALTKTSFRVAGQDKELLLLPILSLLAAAVSFVLVVGVAWKTNLLPTITDDGTSKVQPAGLALALLLYFLLAFVQTYFGAAIVAGAMERLRGGNPTLSSSLAAVNKRMGRILAWSAIVATANVIFQLIRERGGNAGRLVAALGNMAWALATYFMLPVLLFEEAGVVPAIGRSGSLFKKTWGEQVIGNGGVGLVFGIVGMVLVFLGILLVRPLVAAGHLLSALPIVAVFVAAFLVLMALQAVVQGVYKAALYRYATTGQAEGGFTAEQLQSSFRPK